MLNVLLITDSFNLTKKLLDEINVQNLDIRIGGIKETFEETLVALEKFDIDVILLDKRFLKSFDKTFLQNHNDIIITLSGINSNNLISIKNLKLLRAMCKTKDLINKRHKIVKELEFIGYKFKYKGTHYLVDTILLMFLNQDSMVDNLQGNIYPLIAEKYNKTILNIKSSINKATECMYCECDSKKLEEYFNFSYDAKPTVKQVVFAVANKI